MDKVTTTEPSSSSSTSTDPATTSTTTTTTSHSGDHHHHHQHNHPLRHLHRFSHKISKPRNPFDSLPHLHHHHHQRPPPPPPPADPNLTHPQPPPQNQPPVYNINKNDFRDVVQKLTGASPHDDHHHHHRISSPSPSPPPPVYAPKPPSSRLQRIRPPPLSQIAPPLLDLRAHNQGTFPTSSSPLPPLPSCHAAAESPVTAYMRFLNGSAASASAGGDSSNAGGYDTSHDLVCPTVSSPLPFGCFPSSSSSSPRPLFSPTGTGQFGFPQLPVSPRVPAVPSPK